MPDFWLPSAEGFAKRHSDEVPTAVLRLNCSNDHPMAEWWLMSDGSTQSWGGRYRSAAERGAVFQEVVGGYGRPAPTVLAGEERQWPTDPNDAYFLTWIVCPRATCKEQEKFRSTKDLDEVVRALLQPGGLIALDKLWRSIPAPSNPGFRDPKVITHPSGAICVGLSVQHLRRALSARQ